MKEELIGKKIIISLYGVSVLLLIISNLFNPTISNWIKDHLGPMFFSLLMILFAWFLGILSKDDVIGTKSFTSMKVCLLGVQVFFSLVFFDPILQKAPIIGFWYDLFFHNLTDPSSRALILFAPTIVYILQTFFKRLIKIQNLLEETKEQKPQYFKIPDEE